VESTWIDKYQARLFIGIAGVAGIAFIGTVALFGKRPIEIGSLKALSFSLGLGLAGLASAIVILALVWTHSNNKDYWGQAKDSYFFIVVGGIVTFIAAAFQLFESFVAVLPK
jgi:SNF family Na+-dependent transporter